MKRFFAVFKASKSSFFGGRLLFTVIPFHCEFKKDVLALKDEKNVS